MIFQTQEILFVSFNEFTADSFERYVTQTAKEFAKNSNFRLVRESKDKAMQFTHLTQVQYFLESLELNSLTNFILIIDHNSFPLEKEEDFKQVLKEIILQYPEVKIAFFTVEDNDYSWKRLFTCKDLACRDIKNSQSCKLTPENHGKAHKAEQNPKADPPLRKNEANIYKCKICQINIKVDYIHSFNFFEKDAFDLLIRGQSNLFDASNLRNVIKQEIFSNLPVNSNYPKLQCSRNQQLGLSVDEEIFQAYFNAYALYLNGYRALPVVSFKELEKLSKMFSASENRFRIDSGLKIILRDYDLQFEDYDLAADNYTILHELRGTKPAYIEVVLNTKCRYDVEKGEFSCVPAKLQLVENEIKKWGDNLIHTKSNSIITLNKDGKKRAITLDLYEKFWQPFETEIWLITGLPKKKTKREQDVFIRNNDFCTDDKSKYLGLSKLKCSIDIIGRGLNKPIDGFTEFQDIDPIGKSKEKIKEKLSISSSRGQTGSHSTPPIVLHIGEALLNRSVGYYKEGNYLLSSLLAREACEVLNGFHFILILKAIYQYAIAETRLITECHGIDEDKVASYSRKRMRDIIHHVDRLCANREHARKNILSQIFNDMRHIYKEKEQFKASDEVLNQLITVRYGTNISWLKNSWEKFNSHI
ncbi:MAG: hypothetical protein ACOYNC_00990 [Bacteroidales bacterium]